jgi:hypothetical protein
LEGMEGKWGQGREWRENGRNVKENARFFYSRVQLENGRFFRQGLSKDFGLSSFLLELEYHYAINRAMFLHADLCAA